MHTCTSILCSLLDLRLFFILIIFFFEFVISRNLWHEVPRRLISPALPPQLSKLPRVTIRTQSPRSPPMIDADTDLVCDEGDGGDDDADDVIGVACRGRVDLFESLASDFVQQKGDDMIDTRRYAELHVRLRPQWNVLDTAVSIQQVLVSSC